MYDKATKMQIKMKIKRWPWSKIMRF